jgi:hypothetical protein
MPCCRRADLTALGRGPKSWSWTIKGRARVLYGMELCSVRYGTVCVCVYYWRTYYKAVRGGGGGEWRTCATRLGDLRETNEQRRTRAEWRRSESGHDGGWRLRLVAVANCGAADRSIGSNSARTAAAPGSLAGLPRFSDHADVHQWQRPAIWGRRRSGWAAAPSCVNQWPGCGARPRLGFAARGRCGPSPSALQGQIRSRSISGEMFRSKTSRPSWTANARVCTSRMPCALTAILLPESHAHGCHMLQTWFPEWTRLGVHVARGREQRRRRRG